jgi:hypothetical protein
MTVKGVLEEAKLANYVYMRIGKHVSIIKSELVASLESGGGDGMANEDKKVEGVAKDNEGDGSTGGEEKDNVHTEMDGMAISPANQYYTYYPQFAFPGGYNYQTTYPPSSYYTAYAPHHQMMAPQTFSDENPNACSII